MIIPFYIYEKSIQFVIFVLLIQFQYECYYHKKNHYQQINASSPSLSIVSQLHSFHINTDIVIFRSIKSWMMISSDIIILVEDQSLCIHVLHYFPYVRCILHKCLQSQLHIPMVNCLLITGQENSKSNTIMYINSDVIMSPNTSIVISKVATKFPSFLIVGRRTYYAAGNNISEALHSENIFEYLLKQGKLDTDVAMDYFIFTRNSLPLDLMPNFLVGNTHWDNWLFSATLYYRYSSTIVIDATSQITAIHLEKSSLMGKRLGYSYNIDLFLNANFTSFLHCAMTYNAGKVSYATYTLLPNDDFNKSYVGEQFHIRNYLQSYLNPLDYLLIVSLSKDTLSFFDFHLQYLSRLQSLKYLYVAEDQQSKDFIIKKHLNVFNEYISDIELLSTITSFGYGVLFINPSILLLSNPFEAISRNRFSKHVHRYNAITINDKSTMSFNKFVMIPSCSKTDTILKKLIPIVSEAYSANDRLEAILEKYKSYNRLGLFDESIAISGSYLESNINIIEEYPPFLYLDNNEKSKPSSIPLRLKSLSQLIMRNVSKFPSFN